MSNPDLLSQPIAGVGFDSSQPFQQDLANTSMPAAQMASHHLPTADAQQITSENSISTETILDEYFSRLHGSPYYILDEAATRRRIAEGRLPRSLVLAIYAATIRFVMHHTQAYNTGVQASRDYTLQARAQIDIDEPSIENLQALLLLSIASLQCGKGKKSYMLLSHAISMAFALDLHHELPADLQVPAVEQEGRRKLFWTCYIMDRFAAAGSKRPPMIADEFVDVRLPAKDSPSNYNNPGVQYLMGSPGGGMTSSKWGTGTFEGSMSLLIKITQILGMAVQYLSRGGTKTDSHFPWNVQSILSKIRAKLDGWHESTQDTHLSADPLISGRDDSVLMLAKLVYHLIHCLIYRPFLPVDYAEAQVQFMPNSWQIEATNAIFAHANAIIELAECAKSNTRVDCSAFAAFCVCTAGTVHVHGAHYADLQSGDVFGRSAEYLVRGAARLEELRYIWANADHQRDTLRTVRVAHKQLMQAVARGSLSGVSIFQMDSFFERYADCGIDGSHISFTESSARLGSMSEHWQRLPTVPPHGSGPSHMIDKATFVPHSSESPGFVQTRHDNFLQSYVPLSPDYMSTSQHDSVVNNPHITSDQMDGLPSGYLEQCPTQHGPTSGESYSYLGHAGGNYASMQPVTCAVPSSEEARHDSLLDAEGHSPSHDPFLSMLEGLSSNREFSINPDVPGMDMDYFLGGVG